MERRVAGAQAILIRGERIGRPAVRNAHHRRHFAHWPLQIAHQLRKRRARSRRSRGSKRGTAGHRVGAAWAGAETRDPAKKAISPKRKPAVTDGSGRGLKRVTGGIPRGMLEKTPAKSGRHRIRTCDLYGVKAPVGGSRGLCFASVSGENHRLRIVLSALRSCKWHCKRDDNRDENGTRFDRYGAAVVAQTTAGGLPGFPGKPPAWAS